MAFDAALKAEEVSGESESEREEEEEEVEQEMEPELERELERVDRTNEFVEADSDMDTDEVSLLYFDLKILISKKYFL